MQGSKGAQVLDVVQQDFLIEMGCFKAKGHLKPFYAFILLFNELIVYTMWLSASNRQIIA